jgi:hypothetical protein
MNDNRFRDAMGQIDDRLLERCEAYGRRLAKKKRIRLQGVIAAAACFAVLVSVTLFVPHNEALERISLFTANEIAALFPKGDGLMSDSGSIAVYAPDEKALGLLPVPEDNSLPIFLRTQTKETISEESVRAFANGILPGVAQALGGTVPEYTVDIFSLGTESARFEAEIGGHGVSASQYGYLNHFAISRFPLHSAKATATALNGHMVQINQTQTDEEIIASLSGVHQILQDIFGVKLPDVKLIRTYNEDSDYGCVAIQVYFYKEDANVMNAYTERPVSDHIELWFFNNPIFREEECSVDMLQYVDICYRDWRTEEGEMYKENAMAEMLSLQEAEALLKKGYSFGGHSCEICYPILTGVDFTDYDAVSFTYYWNNTAFLSGETVPCVPFYVFYKHIGTAENGNQVYAQTYVPAVYVSGLEEYFANQH